MNKLLSKIQSFFIAHTVWMHITAILAMSFLFMKLSQLESVSIFWGWVAALVIFSMPVLGFAIFRDRLFAQNKRKYWMSWIVIFILFPFLLFKANIDVNTLVFTDYLFHVDIEGNIAFASLSMLFIVIEVIALVSLRSKASQLKLPRWLSGLSVFKMTTVGVAIFCIFLFFGNNYISEYKDGEHLSNYPLRFIACFFFLYITYLSYYIYYYIHHKLLYNTILKKRGLLPYFLSLLLTILLVAPFHNYIISCLPMTAYFKLHTVGLAPNIYDDLNFGLPILVLLASFPLIVIVDWYKQSNERSELEKQQAKTELSLLRQQINPHFFFNTLNNLYSMSLTNEKETPETILHLSELMRYVIYKGKEEKVLLSEEIKYIKDYVQLQMIRVHKTVDYKFDIDTQNENTELPPLLFIILVENAFKHGVEVAGTNCTLHISLKQENEKITFTCHNSKTKAKQDESAGIGLDNLKKRLQILYPQKHELILDDQETSFTATLTIPL